MPNIPKYAVDIDHDEAIKSFKEFFELQEKDDKKKWIDAFYDLELDYLQHEYDNS